MGGPALPRRDAASLQTTDEALGVIERWRTVREADALSGIWAATLRESSELVGTIMLKQLPLSAPAPPLPLSGDYEIGWHLHPDHWGHGLLPKLALG